MCSKLKLPKTHPLRIHIVTHSVRDKTGSARRLVALASGLRDRGHEVTLVTRTYCSAIGELSGPVSLSYLHSHEVSKGPLGQWKKLLRAAALFFSLSSDSRKYREIIKGSELQPPDIVIIRNGLTILAVRDAYKETPVIWDVGIETRRPLSSLLLKRAGTYSSAIVTQNSGRARMFKSLGLTRRQPVHVLLPGLRTDRLISTRKSVSSISIKPFVLHAGSIHPRKNQITSLRAFAAILPSVRSLDPRLVFLGQETDESYAEALKKEIERLKITEYVLILGWREDVIDFIANADLLVLPSRDEGISNVLQEGMLLGAPIAASDEGGNPDIITDQVTGWLHSAEDTNKLSEIILKALTDKEMAKKLSKNAHSWAWEHFTIESWAERYERVILETLAARGLK